MEASQAAKPFGWPLHCPKCPPKDYYGVLKVPGDAAGNKAPHTCPNCNTKLVATGERA